MKKVIFFTCEPGGAEVLIPVIQKMSLDSSFDILVLTYGFAIDRFQKKSIPFIEITPIIKDDFSLFDKYLSDFIITSATSLPQKDMSEKYLWHNAKQKNIPTIAFLDQWQNYAVRFSGIDKNEYLKYQPDIINCINNIAKQEMIKLGFNSKKLLELGHPYLSQLQDNVIDKDTILKTLKLNTTNKIVLFISEAIAENYGNTRGYTQYNTIDFLLSNKEFIKDKQIIIKLHPKDDISKYQKYKNHILIQNEYSSLEMISISDYVIGMTSIMLIEAYILNKCVLSIQLNLHEDLLLLSKMNLICRIDNNQSKISKKMFKREGLFNYIFEYENFKNLLVQSF